MRNDRPGRFKRLAAGAAVLATVASFAVGLAGGLPSADAATRSACSGADANAFTPPAGEAANCLNAYGIALGKADGSFGEHDSLIRAQFASFVTRFLTTAGVPHTARLPFPDVNASTTPDANVVRDIEEGHAAGVVNGFSKASTATGHVHAAGDFGPNESMSVAQAATIVLNLASVIHDHNAKAPDLGPVLDPTTGEPDTSKSYDEAVSDGLLDTTAAGLDGVVYPSGKTATVQRGLFADMLTNLLQMEVDAGVITNIFATNQKFTVTPNDAASVAQGGNRQFTVTGLDNATTYTIELFKCGRSSTDSDNQTSFKQTVASPPSGIADQGAPAASASISVINGVATAGGNTLTAKPSGGSLAFTVKNSDNGGAATSCVTPVVYIDSNADGLLQVDKTTGQPTEDFGVGGNTTFGPAQATNGAAAAGTVTAITDQTSAEIDTGGGVFRTVVFRSGDTYEVANGALCPTVTAAVFFTNLSVGDTLATKNTAGSPTPYSTTGANEFCLSDIQPANPTALAAAPGTPSDTSVKLTWTAAANATSYNVYQNKGTCASTTLAKLTKVGNSTSATFTATGLTASTTYCFVVTSVSGTDESTLAIGGTPAGGDDNTVEALTTATSDAQAEVHGDRAHERTRLCRSARLGRFLRRLLQRGHGSSG